MKNNIKEVRRSMKLTQEQFADLIGNEQRNLSNWERGSKEPSFETLIRIADVCHVSVDYLLCRTDVTGNPVGRNALSDDERSLLQVYDLLDARHKETVRGFANQQLDNQLLTRGMVEFPTPGAAG